MRVAVHTGLVVVADMGSVATPDRDAIVGDTPNVAARLQDHAAPGTLVISHDTYELVRPWFLVAPLGDLELRGVRAPVRAYTVVDEAPEDSGVLAQADLSPFVGRDRELQSLEDAWVEVRGGGSATVALVGQPGVGKSRLADQLRRRVEADDGASLATGCSSFHVSTALYPARRLLERAAGIDAHQRATLALPRLWSAMDALGLADGLPVVAGLLELPPEPWCPAPELDAARLREATLATLFDWVAASAARGPLLLLVEDLQWADPTTLELIGRIVRADLPGLLLLVTAREEVKVPWSSATVLELDRLADDELAELARRLPEGRLLDPGDLTRAIQRSDGIPLFLEELVRASSVAKGETPGSNIPAALRDLLLARFVAPGVDLRVAQLLATIGPEGPLPLVAAVTRTVTTDVDRQIGALVDAGIVALVPGDPPSYRFRHHLLADLAYDTQLLGARAASHTAVADALLAGVATGSAAAPTVLAHHLERAGRTDDAVAALAQAIEAAHLLGANQEVKALLDRAFVLLEDAGSERRTELEIELRVLRAMNAAAIMGYAAPDAVADFEACRDLLGEPQIEGYLDDDTVPKSTADTILWVGAGVWGAFMLKGNLDAAHQVNRSLRDTFRPGGEKYRYFDSARAYIDLFEGDFRAAVPGLFRSLEDFHLVERDQRQSIPGDTVVTAHAHLAFALGGVCRFDEARAHIDAGITVAESIPYPHGPFARCYVGGMAAGVSVLSRDLAAARRHTEAVAEVAERHGFTFWSMIAGYYAALLDLHDEQSGAADRARGAVGLLRAVGVLVWLPSFAGGNAEALLLQGDVVGAREQLDEAAQVAEETGAHYWSTEIARLRGEAAHALGDPDAVTWVRRALDLAVAQGATLMELRARTSLCRMGEDADEREALARLVEQLRAEGLGDAVDVVTAASVLAAR